MIGGMAALMLLGLPAMICLIIVARSPSLIVTALLLALVVVDLVAVLVIALRSERGRIAGIIACVVMLLVPPFTIVSIGALPAFIRGKQLFGGERIRHRDVRIAYQALKRRG